MKKWTLYLGKIAGIKIFVHWTFLILIGWLVIYSRLHGQSFYEILLTIGFLLSVFACVTLHELGHAIAAKRYNCITRDITLLPIGGIARMEKLPEVPLQEMIVAIAGPMVNVVIAALLYFGFFYGTALLPLQELSMIKKETFMLNLFITNVALVVFNLIPAFPMDGGRVLRALLSFRYERHVATRIAATVGQAIAIIFVFTGLFANPFLVFIGLFIFLGAQIEAEFYQSRFFLKGYHVKDIIIHNYASLNADDPLSEATKKLLDVQSTNFLVMQNEKPVGTLNRTQMIKGITEYGDSVSISKVMDTKIQFLNSNALLVDVYTTLRTSSSNLFPVMKDDKLIGIIDLENIMEFIMLKEALEKNKKHQN